MYICGKLGNSSWVILRTGGKSTRKFPPWSHKRPRTRTYSMYMMIEDRTSCTQQIKSSAMYARKISVNIPKYSLLIMTTVWAASVIWKNFPKPTTSSTSLTIRSLKAIGLLMRRSSCLKDLKSNSLSIQARFRELELNCLIHGHEQNTWGSWTSLHCCLLGKPQLHTRTSTWYIGQSRNTEQKGPINQKAQQIIKYSDFQKKI